MTQPGAWTSLDWRALIGQQVHGLWLDWRALIGQPGAWTSLDWRALIGQPGAWTRLDFFENDVTYGKLLINLK